MNPPNLSSVVWAADICHADIRVSLVLRRVTGGRIVDSWVTEPEAQICNGIVPLCALQASDSVAQAILLDAVVEAPAFHLLARDANDLLDASGGVHDGQCAREAVQKESRARLMSLLLRTLSELA